ncbi:hypothetical protein BFJ71_g17270 [Fusarium oxysporum]|nr:hypothetical protein BFJ71_g17270 [Fusarium oxysporum]
MLSSYGIRKEVTLRFDIILVMWASGCFQATHENSIGPLDQTAPLEDELDVRHLPFWTIPTKDINAIIFAQAARFVLPLDHLFFQAGTGLSEQRAQSDLAQCFVGEKMLSYDQWIWLARWTVPSKSSRHREELIERQGLGLENVVKTSGMLWIPPNKMDWQRGHLALDVLLDFVDVFFQNWLKEARTAFESDRSQDAEELLERAFSLATEEIARAYHQHVLLKLQSYWERDRARIGQDKLPPLSRLQECIEDSATEDGQIVTAQTIWEIYAEGWSLYAEVCADADPNKLPQELPYWMTTRTYVPPHDRWSSFVFHHLFHRGKTPSWNHLHFLRLYRAFKESWRAVQQYAGSFDHRFRHVVGDFIMVTLNSSQNTEVGTYKHDKPWYRGKPIFFKIQFWAPYFSPPDDNRRIPWEWVRDHKTRHPGIAPDAKSKDMTVGYFHDLESTVRRLLQAYTHESGRLYSATPACRDSICSSALNYLSKLVGPRWPTKHGPPYLLPWHLPTWKEREGGREDFLLLPIPAGTVSKEYWEIKHSRPTLLLPTRDNVARLLDVVESFPDLSVRTLEQIEWMDKMLDNIKGQFALRSHLNVKVEATAANDRGDSYLRRFLLQTKPPERIIQSSDCACESDQGLECCVSTALEDDDSCSGHSSEELD